ncbi:restriction endonuclease subunit S [Methanothermococcus sp. SCGC AD-155-M21]|nr:restriction endonuclease subunit S [Methanothermococcus sp. SCGC AD-155-M21]
MTEVKEMKKLPEGWKRVRLGEVIIENPKSPFKVEDADNSGKYPFFTSGDKILSHSRYIVDGKNLFLSTGGSAYVKFYEGKTSYSADTYSIKSKEVNNKYLYFYILRLINFITYRYFIGSGLEHLQKEDLKKTFFISLPPLPEQQKIAEILETVDKTIEKTDKIIEKYKRIKQGLMQDLLTKGIDENGKIRSEETHKFKDSPLGRIPEEWEVVRLGEVSRVKRGASPRPIDTPIYFTEKGKGRAWVRIEDVVKSTKYLKETKQYLSKYGEAKSVKAEIDEIIMSICATIGKLIIIKIPACIHDGFVALKNLSDEVNKEYLYYIINFKEKEIIQLGQTGTQGNLNSTIVSSIQIPLPPLPEQQKIAKILSKIDEIIEKEEKYKEKLKKIKQGLMEDLLTGKVRVNHLIEEGVENVQ